MAPVAAEEEDVEETQGDMLNEGLDEADCHDMLVGRSLGLWTASEVVVVDTGFDNFVIAHEG